MSNSDHLNFIKDLALHGILPSYAKAKAQMNFVAEYDSSKIGYNHSDKEAIENLGTLLKLKDSDAIKKWKVDHLIDSQNELLKYAHYLSKRQFVVNNLLEGTGESLFLRYKDRLDRVLYRLIRVESEDLAHHIYYSIESDETKFGAAAKEHSCGPEAKTQGIIGPVDLTTPHPEIAARLKTASPGQIFEPFFADQWFVLVKLEYRFDSEYDESTKQFLGNLVLDSKANQSVKKILDRLTSNEE